MPAPPLSMFPLPISMAEDLSNGTVTITGGALTNGSVVFATGASSIGEDPVNFVWDDANNRLGIGVATPQSQLHVYTAQAGAGVSLLEVQNDAATDSTAVRIAFTVSSNRVIGTVEARLTDGTNNNSSILFANRLNNSAAVKLWLDHNGFLGVNKATAPAAQLEVAERISTTGTPAGVLFTGAAHTTLANAEWNDVYFNLGQTKQLTGGAGAITAYRAVRIDAPTVSAAAAQTITDAATCYISAAPTAGTNATLTATWALWVDAGNIRGDGVIKMAAGSVSAPAYGYTSDGNSGVYSGGNDMIRVSIASIDRLLLGGGGVNVGTVAACQTIKVSSTAMTSTVAATTEIQDALFDLSHTVTFQTGAITTQRAFDVEAPTYAFVGASTITNAATLYVNAAPVAGANATITNAYAAWFDAGLVRVDGQGQFSDGSLAAPGIAFQAETGTGFRRAAAGDFRFAVTGTDVGLFSTTSVIFAPHVSSLAGFSATTTYDGPAGTVGAPTYYFSGDVNTGMYSPGADTVALSAGGAQAFAANATQIGFFAATPVVKQASAANLTNNVTAGGTTDVVDTWTDLTTYATDAAAIRNAVYQLSRKLKQVNDGLRAYGLLT